MSSLATFIYASQATTEPTEQDLAELLRTARTRNASQNVTGMLVYAFGSFMQQLEGSPDALEPIIASIKADARHTNLRMLAHHDITDRHYVDWAMGFSHPDSTSLSEALPGYRLKTITPLIRSDLITNATMAELLLQRYATSEAEFALAT